MWNIYGKTYNLKEFLDKHPGGQQILELCKNEPDCTALFESYHAFCDMNKIKSIMKKYEIKTDINIRESMFNFKYNGFYNTCKRDVIKTLGYDRKKSKSDIGWWKTVISSSLLFFSFQLLYLFYLSNPFLILLSSFFFRHNAHISWL